MPSAEELNLRTAGVRDQVLATRRTCDITDGRSFQTSSALSTPPRRWGSEQVLTKPTDPDCTELADLQAQAQQRHQRDVDNAQQRRLATGTANLLEPFGVRV